MHGRKSPLVSVVQLVVILALGYLAVTQGWPWIRAQLDEHGTVGGRGGRAESGSATDDPGREASARCLDLAEEASSSLAAGIRGFRQPPYDTAAWSALSLDLAASLGQADNACLCGLPSCREAAAAVAELRRLHTLVDGMIRGEPVATRNPGALREAADDHLDRAREHFAAGN